MKKKNNLMVCSHCQKKVEDELCLICPHCENQFTSEHSLNSHMSQTQKIMTKKLTSYLAARFLAEPNFPSNNRFEIFTSLPFTNFGHQPLLDAKQFLHILFSTVEEIKEKMKAIRLFSRVLWLFFVIWIVALLLINTVKYDALFAFFFISFVFLIILWFLRSRYVIKSYHQISDLRAKLIADLMSDSYVEPNVLKQEDLDKINRQLKFYGNGEIGNKDLMPVLVVTDDQHPFPGYGRLQAEMTYICPPKKEKLDTKYDLSKVEEEIRSSIQDRVKSIHLKDVKFGEIMTIHGDTIPINSPLLDTSKVPLLWLRKDLRHQYLNESEGLSYRTFFVVQVSFPESMTLAFFFIRFFFAGNALGCHISVTTLGPLEWDQQYFQRRLLRHTVEKKDRFIWKLYWRNILKWKILLNKDGELDRLKIAREANKDKERFQSNFLPGSVSRVKLKDKFDMNKRQIERYQDEFQEIIEENTLWPGVCFKTYNLREESSYTFTLDFYGRSESISTVKTIYDQLSKALLDQFDELGFSVKEYRDEEGNYSINAEKIEQLIVGEKVRVHNKNVRQKNNPSKNVTTT